MAYKTSRNRTLWFLVFARHQQLAEPPPLPLHLPRPLASRAAPLRAASFDSPRHELSNALRIIALRQVFAEIRDPRHTVVRNHLYQPYTGRALWLHSQHLHKWYHSTRLVTSSRTHCESSLYDKYSRRYEHPRQAVNRSRRPISSRSTIGPDNGLTIAATPSLTRHMLGN